MDQRQESPTEAVNNTRISNNDNGNFLSHNLAQNEDIFDALNGTERPNSSSDNDISAATGSNKSNRGTEEVEMDTITTSPSSMPNSSNSQSTNDHHQRVTTRSFHKSDPELAAAARRNFARGHKRHASEVYTDAAEVKSGTRESIQ